MFRKILRKLIDTDPYDEPSNLDRWDGRGTVELAGAKSDGFASMMAALADIDGGSLHLVDTGSPAAVVGVPR